MTTGQAINPRAALNMRIALMRFGLGPKQADGFAEPPQSATAGLEGCLAELEKPEAVLLEEEKIRVDALFKDNNGNILLQGNVALTYENCGFFGTGANAASVPLPAEVMNLERRERYLKALEPEIGFVERLVHFWANHFSVFHGKSYPVYTLAGHMERAVIRKHVLGKFSDMLKGVITHSAMIYYLDNHHSYGPNSAYGKQRNIGFNENLAREILELHTLGVGGGYTQGDVTNFAKILTGWNTSRIGTFNYDATAHEPGNFVFMGKTYARRAGDNGMQQGLDVLDRVASHPATAQHIAFKLLVHFVTEKPTPRMVNTLAAAFQRSGGNLKVVAQTLLRMPESWTTPMTRLRTPQIWMLSTFRALGASRKVIEANSGSYTALITSLNHNLWARATPDGYPDENYYWQNPNAIRLRAGVATQIIRVTAEASGLAAADVAAKLMPGMLSQASLDGIKAWRTLDKDKALITFFMSPEFLRR